MNLKKSTRMVMEKSADEQIKNKCYDNALEIINKYRLRNFTITKSRAKSQYKLKDVDFIALSCLEVDNPYYKCAPNMKLYLKQELEDKFGKGAIREKKINKLLTN